MSEPAAAVDLLLGRLDHALGVVPALPDQDINPFWREIYLPANIGGSVAAAYNTSNDKVKSPFILKRFEFGADVIRQFFYRIVLGWPNSIQQVPEVQRDRRATGQTDAR